MSRSNTCLTFGGKPFGCVTRCVELSVVKLTGTLVPCDFSVMDAWGAFYQATGKTTTVVSGASRVLRPGKLDLLFRISHFLDLHAGGRSLFINTSKCYIHSANLSTTAIKSECFIAWKAIMTVEVAGLRGSGR